MLQQNPRFKRIQAELGPGVKLGEGILKLQIDEEDFNEFGFKFNNHRSPSVGAYRGEMSYQHRNVTGLFGDKMGWGDTLSARVGLTEGLKDWAVNYEFPFNRHGASLAFHVDRSDSDVVEAPFNQLDVESEADTYAVTLKYPVPQLKAPGQSLNLSVRMEKRTSKTFLLGRPFSFSPGVQNGESDLSVIRLVADYLKRDQISVFALRSSFNIGLDAFGSTIDSSADDHSIPDSQFFSWLGQFQYVHRLKFSFIPKALQNNSQFIFRTDAQLADQGLLPLEKLSIGGATTVRGYRENYLTRDNGLISSLELRISHDKWKYQISKLEPNPEDGRIEIVPFIDYGRAWNADDASKMDDDIFSVGIGARWTLNQKQQTQLQVYWGHALTDVPDPEDKDLQDDGIHFGITFSKTF
jgi:hemolysin activation/secretion protein